MALTIGLNGLGIIANCDGDTDSAGGTWAESGGGTVGPNPDVYLFGSSSIGSQYASKSGFTYFTSNTIMDFTPVTGAQAGQFIYIWVNISAGGALDILANNGLSIIIGSDTSNYRTYKIAGSDDTNGWSGGWKLFVIDPTIAGSIADVGTFNLATIDTIGIWIDTIVSVRADSMWIDQIAVADGIRVTGTSTTAWQDVVDYCTDYTNRAWGIFQEREGVFYSYGKTYIGDTGQTAITSFKDSGKVIQFGDSEFWNGSAWASSFPADGSAIIFADSAGFTTSYEDGVLVGLDNGRAGSTIIGGASQDVYFDASGFINAGSSIKLYNSQFIDMHGGIKLNDNIDNLFYGGVITGSGQFDPVGAPVLRNLVFSGTIDSYSGGLINGAALLWNANIDIADCQFIANVDITSNPHAIEHPAGGSITYTGLTFSGNDKQILFTAASGDLLITATGGTNASNTITDHTVIGTGTITVSNPITLILTNLVAGSEIRILQAGTNITADATDTSAYIASSGTSHAYNYNYPPSGYTDLDIHVIKPGYEIPEINNITVASSNQTIKVNQDNDRNYVA